MPRLAYDKQYPGVYTNKPGKQTAALFVYNADKKGWAIKDEAGKTLVSQWFKNYGEVKTAGINFRMTTIRAEAQQVPVAA